MLDMLSNRQERLSLNGTAKLDRLAARGRPILACYFVLGDAQFDDALRDLYVEEGVDIFELGIPSADPYLDGPDIAGAMARVIADGGDGYGRMTELADWFAARPSAPAGVCMAYADLDLQRLVSIPLDGALVIGGESPAIDVPGAPRCGLLPLDRTLWDLDDALSWDGYVMVQSADGKTGPREALDPRLAETIAAAREAGIVRPILAGFGIGTPAQARQAIDAGADGVVIGSMCVRSVRQGSAAIRQFLRDVRSALDA
jgi:tryptophan synthase alpha chain